MTRFNTEHFKKVTLLASIFIAGFSGMSIEIIGSRIFAPFFGNSIITWTSIIGVILAALSLGYFFGGKFSKYEHLEKLYSDIFLIASVMTTLMLFEKYFLLDFISNKTDLVAGSFIAGLICFGPINFLLGLILPIGSVIAVNNINKKTGETFGLINAVSTVGSIFGVFLTGYILLPIFGLDTIVASIGVTLALTSVLTELNPRKILFFIIITALLSLSVLKIKNFRGSNTIYSADTLYNHIEITKESDKNGDVKIHLTTGKNELQSSTFVNNMNTFPEEYKKYFHLVEILDPNFKNVLMIGGGAFTSPKDFLVRYPEAMITVIEIDPALKILAKEYFGLKNNPRLEIIDADARLFLNKNEKAFDIILMDAFDKNISPPFQLTSKEAVNKMYQSLNSNGILMANIIGSEIGPGSKFLDSELATYKLFFSHVYVIPVENPFNPASVKNVIAIASKSNSFSLPNTGMIEPASYLKYAKEYENKDDQVLTDNFAPVEYQLLSLYNFMVR